MTSHQNHAATEAFFEEHRHFGLDRSRVHFFLQGRMPAVDFSGKILLETQGTLALSPDGHGGSLRALERSGALELMASEGIDTLSYFQVDNPLVRCIDPAFIGWHLNRASEMSSKTVLKAYPEEKLGHFCILRGKLVVIEYSDLPESYQRERDSSGALRYAPGSIAIHILDREFIRRMAHGAEGLPFHRADKKIATVDASGAPVRPAKANGRQVRALRLRRPAVRQEPGRHRDEPGGRLLAREERRGRRLAGDLPRRPAPPVHALAARLRRHSADG